MENFQIAQSYFSDILNAQLVIFSLIVGFLVALAVSLYFIFVPKFTKRQIEEKVDEKIKKLLDSIKEEIKNESTKEIQLIQDELDKLKKINVDSFNSMQADIARTMSISLENNNYLTGAFDWSIRAARYFSQASDGEKFSRAFLNRAIRIIKKINPPSEVDINMYNDHILIIKSSEKFGIEIEVLNDEIKRLIAKNNPS